MGRPQMTVTKRQREQKKRERQQAKLERRALRKTTDGDTGEAPELVREEAIEEVPQENP